MSRSTKKGPYIDQKLQAKVEKIRASGQRTVIQTWARASTITPEMVGLTIGVHDGRGFEHCWSGYAHAADGSVLPNAITRLTYLQRFLPQMAQRFVETAPAGANMEWHRY